MSGFVDIHHHLLFGLDDGPETRGQMEEMLRKAHEDGIGVIIATPHVTPGVKAVDFSVRERRLSEARACCAANGLDIEVLPGAEILYTPMLENLAMAGSVPTLAGTRYALIEFLPRVRFEEIEAAARMLIRCGYSPILAHVERLRCLMARPKRARRLREALDVGFQINCSALLDRQRPIVRRGLKHLLRERLIDFAATDAHDADARGCRMRTFFGMLEKFAGEEYARKLTELNAQALFLPQPFKEAGESAPGGHLCGSAANEWPEARSGSDRAESYPANGTFDSGMKNGV